MTKEQISELFTEAKAQIGEMIVSAKNETILHRENILSRIGAFEKKVVERPDRTSEIKVAIESTESELVTLIKTREIKDSESIDNLISLINSKEYSPEIKLATDSPEVIEQVNLMKAEMIAILIELRNKLSVKKKYSHKITRDENKLITEIISEEI